MEWDSEDVDEVKIPFRIHVACSPDLLCDALVSSKLCMSSNALTVLI
jgi:hypothetical protein